MRFHQLLAASAAGLFVSTPLQAADPVHGDLDITIGIAHSDKMAAALQGAGVKVDYIRHKGLEHSLEDSNARTEMLTRIGEFLDRTVGR